MNESRRSNRDALPAPAKAPLSDPVPSSALQAFRTSSEAAPALPGVPRTRLPPSFIGQLRLTNGGVLSPPLDSSRLVAHERLPVVTGRLHHHQAYLFVDQVLPQRQDCVRRRNPGPHRLHGFAATPAGNADADLRVPLGHIHSRATAVDDFHDQLPSSAEPSNRSTRAGPRQIRNSDARAQGNNPRFSWRPSAPC